MAIAVVGSLNVDYVVRVPRFPQPGETLTGTRFETFGGGKGANQACAAAKLGADVRLVGCVGGDPQGKWILEQLRAAGVDVSGVGHERAAATGIAVIEVADSGQNHIVIVPGANGHVDHRQLDAQRETIESASCVLLQLEVPDEAVTQAARMARRGGAVVILDPAPARLVSAELLSLCDFVTPNETELSALAGEPPAVSLTLAEVRRLAGIVRERTARVLVKLGPAGALLVGPEGEQRWRAPAVDAVDTTAAGDCFNAAFAVALSEGRPIVEAGRFAALAASLSVTRAGAQPAMPTRIDVEAFAASHDLA
jgi:ribokinase